VEKEREKRWEEREKSKERDGRVRKKNTPNKFLVTALGVN